MILLDDLDDPVATRIDQHGAAVHDRVAIIPGGAVFRRHVIIGDACLGQNRAYPDILIILVRRIVPLFDIPVKAGPVVHAQNPVDAADHAANDATNDTADRAGGSFALP